MQIIPGSEDDVPGQVTINPRGSEAKERAKFEQHPSYLTSYYPVGNPYVFREFPKMLYKAFPNPRFNNRMMCLEETPQTYNFEKEDLYVRACDAQAAFNRQCLVEVKDAAEQSKYSEMGWRESIADAMAFVKERDKVQYVETAHRNYDDRNMSEKARAEIAAAEAASDGQHVPEIVEKRRGGRKPGSKNKPKNITPTA